MNFLQRELRPIDEMGPCGRMVQSAAPLHLPPVRSVWIMKTGFPAPEDRGSLRHRNDPGAKIKKQEKQIKLGGSTPARFLPGRPFRIHFVGLESGKEKRNHLWAFVELQWNSRSSPIRAVIKFGEWDEKDVQPFRSDKYPKGTLTRSLFTSVS